MKILDLHSKIYVFKKQNINVWKIHFTRSKTSKLNQLMGNKNFHQRLASAYGLRILVPLTKKLKQTLRKEYGFHVGSVDNSTIILPFQ